MPLTLDAALKLALRNNLGRLSQDAGVQQAEGQRLSARSALLPNINIGAAEVFAKTNLLTVGLKTGMIPPSVVYNYDDLRGLLQQSVLDFVSIHQFHSATEMLKSSVASARNARDLIVLAVGGSYLQVTATRARLEASQAQVLSAKAVFDRARDRFDAGVAAKLAPLTPKSSWKPRSSARSRCRPIWRRKVCVLRASSACRSDKSSSRLTRTVFNPTPSSPWTRRSHAP